MQNYFFESFKQSEIRKSRISWFLLNFTKVEKGVNKMKKVCLILAMIFAVVTINCTVSSSTMENPLANTAWQIESFGAADNQQKAQRDATHGAGFEPAIAFTDSKISGRIGGCNVISFGYTIQNQKIKTNSDSTTAMACSTEIMKQEREVNAAFQKLETFRLAGDQLEINYDNGKIIRLKRAV